MHVILRYESGHRAEGILLAVTPDRLRVVLQELHDTLELRLFEDRWISEDGASVEIEALISGGETTAAVFYPRLGALTRGAGN